MMKSILLAAALFQFPHAASAIPGGPIESPAGPAAAALAAAQPVVLRSGQPRWAIAREAAGRFTIVGEVVALHTGAEPVGIDSVTLTVFDRRGTARARRVVRNSWEFRDLLVVLGSDGEGGWIEKPSGLRTLAPGDLAVFFLAESAAASAAPVRAEIVVEFDRGPARRLSVPLVEQAPGAPQEWPLDFTGGHFAVLNAAGTPDHWRSFVPGDELYISQRFALDIVRVDGDGRTYDGTGALREDYLAWGQPVRATGDGTVVAASDGIADTEIGDPGDPVHTAGNYVVIQHGPALFSLYAHLRQGSVEVAAGDRVARGQRLGEVGNSGQSTEPHLHLHFVDRWRTGVDPLVSFYVSQGVPALFRNARVRRGSRTLSLRDAMVVNFDLVEP